MLISVGEGRVRKNHIRENNKERKQNRISMARILLDTHVCLKKNLYQNPDWGPNQGKTLFLRRWKGIFYFSKLLQFGFRVKVEEQFQASALSSEGH